MSATTDRKVRGPRSKVDDSIERLSTQFGGRWTGVRFDYGEIPAGYPAGSQMRLCAAVAKSFSTTLVLAAPLVGCRGAKRSLGISHDDHGLVRHIQAATGLQRASIARAVESTPHLPEPAVSVTLGSGFRFDVAVSYCQPASAMGVLRKWQTLCEGEPLRTSISTFLTVCGNALVAAHESGCICVSLGCSTSRREGVFGPDEMVIAVPRRLVHLLTRKGAPG